MTHDEDIDEEERPGRFSLERITSALLRRWLIVLMAMLIVGAVTTIGVLLLPNRYDAAAVVQIDPRKKSISNLDGIVSDLAATSSTVDSEVEVLRSRAIALRVIDILDLRNDPELGGSAVGGSFWDFWRKPPPPKEAPKTDQHPLAGTGNDPVARILHPAPPGSTEPARDAVAEAFDRRLVVTRVRVTLLMEIKFSSRDPVKAARIANTIAEVYLDDQIQEKKRAAGFATGLLQEKLDDLKAKVAAAEGKVEQFKVEHNIFDTEGELLSEKQLNQQMSQTVTAKSAVAAAKAKYEQAAKLVASGQGSSSVAEVLSSDSIKLRKEALAAATRREAELETRYGPRHPEILKVRAEVTDAEAQLNAEVQRIVQNLKNEYEVAESNERQLEASLADLKQQQVLSKEAGVTLKALQREAATEKQLYEALLARYKTTAETQNLQLPDSRIVERADVPLTPASPKRKQIVIAGAAAGLLLGMLLALLLEFAAKGITHTEDVEHALALAHLSSLPQIAHGGPDPSEALRPLRMMLAEPRSAYAEAIRSTRREIDVRSKTGRPRSILVSSSLPNEDAEVVASNLAHHYALLGTRVLLIDGDIRRASLTRRLAPKAQNGLVDVLVRGLAFEKAVLRDASTGLHFLPAMREGDAAGPESLASARMVAVLTNMKRRFDTIIVSAPPLLPVIDGRLLADHADHVVFVMTWRHTPKQLARRALQCLGASRDRIVGVIMNAADPAGVTDVSGHGTAFTVPRTAA